MMCQVPIASWNTAHPLSRARPAWGFDQDTNWQQRPLPVNVTDAMPRSQALQPGIGPGERRKLAALRPASSDLSAS